MKNTPAWLTLCSLVAARQKDEALALYRLLSHRLADQAYAAHIEGDLLWSFGDETALFSYKHAAVLYEKSGRNTEKEAIQDQIALLTAHL